LGDLEGGSSNSADQQQIRPSPSNQTPQSSDLQHPVQWPRLEHLQFSASDLSQRRHSIGGSDANTILSGNCERIRELWLEKRGVAEPADLSTDLSAMLGSWTEAFNRQWYEQLTGKRISSAGRSFACGRYDWRRCTVDGLIEESGSIWEAKHTNAFAKPDEVLERYMPQLQHNMAVTGYEQAALSVIFGNHKFQVFEVASDWLYQIELLNAEQRFWKCVLTGSEPVDFEPPPPPRPIGTREVCLEGNNAWASAAVDWLTHRHAAKLHASACASIKAQVNEDVCRAFGHGIEARRSKSGAITIKELA
jgi:predicted phage-related endonuclease